MTEQVAGTNTLVMGSARQHLPHALVIYEGTIVDEEDKLKHDVWNKLEKLRRTHFVVIASVEAAVNTVGYRRVLSRLYMTEVPFDDLYVGYGLPKYSVLVSDSAIPLG